MRHLAAVVVPMVTLALPVTAHADEQRASQLDEAHPTAMVTTITQAATATQPADRLTPPTVEQIIRAVWPDNLEDRAVRIAWRESRHIPTVRNACCFGLFQLFWTLHRKWMAGYGVTSVDQLYDPRINAQMAYQLYLMDGWTPWQT